MIKSEDTGIFEMLKNNVDDLLVMQYANHYDPNLNTIINEKTPEF